MTRFTTVAVVAALALAVGSATALAQTRPNFAGKWTLDPAAVAAPAGEAAAGGGGRGGGRGGGLGQELTITQDATTVKIDYMGGGRNPGPVSLTYRLDGTDSSNTNAMGAAQVSKATWQGNSLVVTTQVMMGGNSVEQRRTFSLEGGNLVVETVQPGREGGPGTPTRMVYKKAS
jgi:hypothetical protein